MFDNIIMYIEYKQKRGKFESSIQKVRQPENSIGQLAVSCYYHNKAPWPIKLGNII